MKVGSKIVIIEDEQSIREMYRLKLVASGFDVQTAANGTKGLEVIKKFKPILVLVDLLMPGMGGEEMLKKLRKTDEGAAIRVIILTNISRDEAPQTLRLLNVDRYIVKAHYTPQQVIDVVHEILETKQKT